MSYSNKHTYKLKETDSKHKMPSSDGMTYSTASDNRVRGNSYLHDKRSLKHLHSGSRAVLGSHTATNRLGSPRGLIQHTLDKCVPVLRFDGHSVQIMETQGVMFVNAKQHCFHDNDAAGTKSTVVFAT